ncbi:hypothetical protein Bca52824_026649 [Brassica carinata]|uniref:Uncharacterized protein n=1 Tax=Brassica carinata TaxID=52824 RepID=A0A8X7V9Z8_BRACI|nr:hypothetical protein Bca52824_026649 [Brassica carinata]
MVAESKRKETPLRRRTRSTAEKLRPSGHAKQQGYQVVDSGSCCSSYRSTNSVFVISESNAGGSGSERDSTAHGSSPDEVRGGELSVNFTLILGEERHLLLEEVQDSKVTSLVQMMRSGETFKLEDFPGGDTPFRRNLEKKNTGRVPKDEKCDHVPVHQRNLRPHSEPPGPPHSGRCTHENLKPWMLVHFEKLPNQIGEIGRNICKSLVCPRKPSMISGRGKPAMIIIDSLLLLQVLDSKPSGQPGREPKETMQHKNRERRATKTSVTMLETRTPNTAEDAQQQETPSTAVVVHTDVLCAQPQSCVSPPNNTATRRFVDQVGSPVKWGESNPHLYRSVGTVRSIHPSWKANPSSKAKVASTGSEDTGVPLSQQISTEKNQTPSVGHDSGQTSNLEVSKTGEKLAKVPSSIVEDGGQDPPIVEETNPEFPAMEEEERYESCREDMSTDTQMHEK